MTIASLLADGERLRAEIAPLEQRLRRCDDLLHRRDSATAERNAAMAAFDTAVTNQQIYDQCVAPDPHDINMAEIRLRTAQNEARAALKARPEIQARLQPIQQQLESLQRQYDEEIWLAL